ncbi:MAG: hypothetical protein ACI8RZ_006338 [Myxococcota bacterium]
MVALIDALPLSLTELGLVGCALGDVAGEALVQWALTATRACGLCVEDSRSSSIAEMESMETSTATSGLLCPTKPFAQRRLRLESIGLELLHNGLEGCSSGIERRSTSATALKSGVTFCCPGPPTSTAAGEARRGKKPLERLARSIPDAPRPDTTPQPPRRDERPPPNSRHVQAPFFEDLLVHHPGGFDRQVKAALGARLSE